MVYKFYNITMEMDIDIEVNENQISFDFLNEQKETQSLQQAENYDWVADETLVVLIKAKEGFSYDFQICGKSMLDWVSMATSCCQQKTIEESAEEALLPRLAEICEGYEYVAVFYSDTPLLKKSTFLEVMTHFSKRKMNVLKLKRGFVFKTSYLKAAKMMLSTSIEDFGKDDFCVVNDARKMSYAFNVLNNRIVEYHKQQGVVFFGESFVDADVEIEEGAIIYPNNIIKGQSYIGKEVVLESGNFILDTIVCDRAYVCQSYLEKSKIEKGKSVIFQKLISEKV